MKSLTFAQRIALVVAVALGAGMTLTSIAVYRQKQIADTYSQLIEQEVFARRLALSTQVAFKTQVQEWKNVLLRGYQAENLKKYSDSFHAEEAVVGLKADSLIAIVHNDTMATRLATEFATAHKAMGEKYAVALGHFSVGKGLDPVSADAEVKGQDRPPTDLLTALSQQLTKSADLVLTSAQAQAKSDRNRILIITLVVLALTVVFTVYMIRALRASVQSIGQRVEQVREEAIEAMGRASEALARGALDEKINFDVPAIIVQADDEIGALARSVNGIIDQTRASADAFERARAALRALLGETTQLVDYAKAGDLQKRGDASRFEGGYRELLAGFNATLDAVVAPIAEATAVLERVADRDLTARIEGEYTGDHETVKRALNTALVQLETALSDINASTDEVASAGEQIATGSSSLARVTGEQASSIEEVSASLQELTSMSRSSSNSAKAASALVEEARVCAVSGVASTRELSVAMGELKVSADSTAKIVRTIDELAFQTNLLALNAAVEAARAGDAGRGFAVVAEEVRNLAIRSAEAAKNTATLIADSVTRAHRGGEMSATVLTKLNEIEERVGKVSAIMTEIGDSSAQQESGVSQIATAVEQLSRTTQEVAANSEESAAAAHELAAQAASTRESVSEFTIAASTRKQHVTSRPMAPTKRVSTPVSINRGSPRDAGIRRPVGAGVSGDDTGWDQF